MTLAPEVWDGVLRRLRQELPASLVDTWLGPVVFRPHERGLKLLCPTRFHCERVRSALLEQIVSIASEAKGEPVDVVLEVANEATEAPARCEADRTRDAVSQPEPAEPETARDLERREPQPCSPVKTETHRNTQALRKTEAPRAGAAVARPAFQPRFAYTFDNFVVGPCNALAREASLALVHGEQKGLEQVYLDSSPGLGKTHLCRAAAAEARRSGDERVLYTSAEAFTSAFTSALRSKQMARFKQRFRFDPHMLVIEDVHFLAGKKQTQLELFHTLRHVLDTGGRVLLSGDRLPKDLTGLEECLRSQIQGGFVAELESPDANVRRNILRSKAARGGVRLPDDCLDLLVDTIRGSVRELEGVLIQLVATASLLKKAIDLPLTREALSKKIGVPKREATCVELADILQVVALFFKTTPAAMASRSRRRDAVIPRQLAMYLARRYTEASLSEIGKSLGRNHPAVRNAITKTERAILERVPLRYQVEALTDRLDELMAGRQS